MLLRRVYHNKKTDIQFLSETEKTVLEPEALVNKKVISSDFQEIDKDSLKILRGSDNHYIIPKSRVLTFTGENMRVDFRFNDLLLVRVSLT